MPNTHIFCQVVDNYGDLGVCWRLARQLVQEHGHAVMLWVDDWATVQRMTWDAGVLTGLHWQHWPTDDARLMDLFLQKNTGPVDWLVEGFGCRLPEALLALLARQTPAPRWINLDYLSAEDWTLDCHGLGSPHPRLPLVQQFFFPGFDPRSGGLLRECDLLTQADRFRHDPAARSAFWAGLGVNDPDFFALKISLFAYRGVQIQGLLAALRDGAAPTLLALTDSQHLQPVQDWLLAQGYPGPLQTGQMRQVGALSLLRLPFLAHQDFDRLLWACDLNLIRGEDSLVRAIWAGQPWLWHIYPQAGDTHHLKLAALCTRLQADLADPPDLSRWLAALQQYGQDQTGLNWADFLTALPQVRALTRQWRTQLAAQPDLCTRLLQSRPAG